MDGQAVAFARDFGAKSVEWRMRCFRPPAAPVGSPAHPSKHLKTVGCPEQLKVCGQRLTTCRPAPLAPLCGVGLPSPLAVTGQRIRGRGLNAGLGKNEYPD